MKRGMILALLLALSIGLCGCASVTTQPIPESTLLPGADTVLPGASDNTGRTAQNEVTLWFRFSGEPYLAAETRTITQLTGQSFEMALLEALFAGPGTRMVELVSALPEGSRVLSTVRQGRTLLVTVSREFLEIPADVPVDWQEYDTWRVEAPLRRRLAMQSLTATATENCDVDEVLVLVEQGAEAGASLRLKQNWFLDDSEDSVLTGPQVRDDSLLLTPEGTGQAVIACWLRRDWSRLYRFTAAQDAYTGAVRPAYRDFVAQMEALPVLTDAACTGCSVAGGGEEATLSARMQIRDDGGALRTLQGRVLRLRRENGLWKISMEQLTGWLEK